MKTDKTIQLKEKKPGFIKSYYILKPNRELEFIQKFIPDDDKEPNCEILLQETLPRYSLDGSGQTWVARYGHKWDDKEVSLVIEQVGHRTVEITLTNVTTFFPVVNWIHQGQFRDWSKVDWGKIVWDPQHQDYVLKKGLHKSFFILDTSYNPEKELAFNFSFVNHLVQKDKDSQKNWIWYQFDYVDELGVYIYDLVSPHLEYGEIVAFPGETGGVLIEWDISGWPVRAVNPTTWPNKKPQIDFYWATKEKWISLFDDLPALVITFLPTNPENYRLEEKNKLTGTRWFKKLYEVFIQHDVPVVLKCYPGFIRQMIMNHPEWHAKLSKTIELPQSIMGKAMNIGTGGMLAFFNITELKDMKKQELDFNKWLNSYFVRVDELVGQT